MKLHLSFLSCILLRLLYDLPHACYIDLSFPFLEQRIETYGTTHLLDQSIISVFSISLKGGEKDINIESIRITTKVSGH